MVKLLFIMDILMRMWQGDIVAWIAFLALIGMVALGILGLVLYWKMPQPAKKLLWNNLFGHRPVVANAYDNGVVKFETPTVLREGIAYSKDTGYCFMPRLTDDAEKILSPNEQNIVNKFFNIEGSQGQFFLKYSAKGTITNPELQNLIEHADQYAPKNSKKSNNPHTIVQIPRELLIATLNSMKDKFVTISPLHISRSIDPRKLKQYLGRAFGESQLHAMELDVQEAADKEAKGGVYAKAAVLLGLANIVIVVILALKTFKVF